MEKIFVLDDEVWVVDDIGLAFESSGIKAEVIAVSNKEEFLSHFEACHSNLDFVFIDGSLTNKSYDTNDIVTKVASTPDFIGLSIAVSTFWTKEMLEDGCDIAIDKMFLIDQILKLIAAYNKALEFCSNSQQELQDKVRSFTLPYRLDGISLLDCIATGG